MASGISKIHLTNSYTQLADLKITHSGSSADIARSARSRLGSMEDITKYEKKIYQGEAGYVLEDVPHLADYLPDLPVSN